MEEFNLSSLFGPQPVFISKAQLASLATMLDAVENGIAVAIFNEGAGTLSARVYVGDPETAENIPSSETVFGYAGGAYPVGVSDDDPSDGYTEKLSAAIELAAAESPLPELAEVA